MGIHEDASELLLDQLTRKDLSLLATTCKHFKAREKKTISKCNLNRLLDPGLPRTLFKIIELLNNAANGQAGVVETENKVITGVPREGAVETFRFKAVVDIIIAYEAACHVLDLLTHSEDGRRIHWHKPDHEIAEILGDSVGIIEVQAAKKIAVQQWFSSIGLGLPSDEQAVVIANCHNSLRVIARAGSGKTRTIAQKVLFLVHYIGCRPDEILALAFNGKAQKELLNRITQYEQDANLPSRGAFKVLTFDALAFNIVKPRLGVLKDSGQQELIKDTVLDAINNEEGLKRQVEKLMLTSFRCDWDKVLRLNSLSSPADLDRLRGFLAEETLDGKEVRSRAEKRIADFLFEHDIPYLYETPFPVDDGHVIRPDFYIPFHKIVIEYCGLKGDDRYDDALEYKRRHWLTRPDITLIEIDPGFICRYGASYDESRERDYKALSDLLIQQTGSRLQPRRLSDEEIIARLRDRIELTFVQLLQSALARAGQMTCSESDFIDLLSQYSASTEEERAFLDLLPTFYAMYLDRLSNNNLTDFNLIKKAAIDKILAGQTVLDWDQGANGVDLRSIRYVFVDEFQDFSDLFRDLLLAILGVAPGALVNAVGDDWQMINRFAGSKPELFDQFDTDYPKPLTVYLQTNYRSAGGIVEFCNSIMKANGVDGKPAIASDAKRHSPCLIARLDRDQINTTPREDHYFQGDSLLMSIFRLYLPLAGRLSDGLDAATDKLCFAISRTNNPPLRYRAEELGIAHSNARELINGLVDRWAPQGKAAFFEAITGHKSKGLEADTVIVLQPKQYPMIRRRSLFLQFFGDTPTNLLRDELNLFYVTCSRAKNRLYFLPEAGYMMSPFIEDLDTELDIIAWDRFPCLLASPVNLHQIMIQDADANSGDLRLASDLLKAHGFKFGRPGKIPTRSQVVRQDLFGALSILKKISESCSDYNLAYTILDGLNHQVFQYPGPKSISEALAEYGGEV